MAKLVMLLFVAMVAAIASAAPVAEEDSAPLDIAQLIEQANVEENDIFAPVTETHTREEEITDTVFEENVKQLKENKDVPLTVITDTTIEENGEPLKKNQELPMTDGELDIVVIPTDTTAVSTDKTMDEEKAEQLNATSVETDKQKIAYDALIPVTEVIPEPEVAHVLGSESETINEEDDVDQNINKDQNVQGENEEEIPFISEYRPETSVLLEEENIDEPIVESVIYEYPPDDIRPEAVLNIEETMSNSDNDPAPGNVAHINSYPNNPMNDNMGNTDDFSTFEELINYHNIINGDMPPLMDSMNTRMPDVPIYNDVHLHDTITNDHIMHSMHNLEPSMMDYPMNSHFDSTLDYEEAFPSISFGESSFHTIPEGPPINFYGPVPFDDGDLALDYIMHEYGNSNTAPGPIVAGLNENYHPEPMPGNILNHGEVFENPDVDYPLYDDLIIPAAMINFDYPAVEEPNFEDDFINNPLPERPSMVEFPRPVAEFPVNQDPMASMQPMMINDISENEGFNPDMPNKMKMENSNVNPSTKTTEIGLPIDIIDSETNEDPTILVIKLDVKNRKATVNGKPFAISHPANILDFIEEYIRSASMSYSLPPSKEEYYNFITPNPFYNSYDFGESEMNSDMMMQHYNPEYYNYQSPDVYSSYMDEPDYDPYYQSSYDFDYLPYNPFLNAIRRRLMIARYNKMSSFNNRFRYGFKPRFGGRYDYNDY